MIPCACTVTSPRVSVHAVCVKPLTVSEPSLVWSPQKPCFDCLFSGPDTGGSFSEGKCKKKMNVQRDALFHTAQNHEEEEIMQKQSRWFSPRGSVQTALHCIFLIEPPAAPTSHAGPAYQDLRAARSGQ